MPSELLIGTLITRGFLVTLEGCEWELKPVAGATQERLALLKLEIGARIVLLGSEIRGLTPSTARIFSYHSQQIENRLQVNLHTGFPTTEVIH